MTNLRNANERRPTADYLWIICQTNSADLHSSVDLRFQMAFLGNLPKMPTTLKVSLHDTIRSCGCRHIVTCGVLVECSGPMKIGWLGIRARSILQPILSHLLCDHPIRAQWPFKSTFTSFNHDGEDGLVYECTERRPCCFETFVYPITWNYFVEPI